MPTISLHVTERHATDLAIALALYGVKAYVLGRARLADVARRLVRGAR